MDDEKPTTLGLIALDAREAATLADAIDAYRSVRTDDSWPGHRLPYDDRMSPAELDSLRRRILTEEDLT